MERFELPNGWKWRALGNCLVIKYGKSLPDRIRTPSGNVPVYGSNGIVGRHDSAVTAGETIIIGRKGSVGAVNFSPVPCWPIDTAFFCDEFPDDLDVTWLYSFLSCADIAHFGQDGPKPGVRRDSIYEIEIPVPPPEEQKRLVAYIKAQTSRAEAIRKTQVELVDDMRGTLAGYYAEITANASWKPLGEVAPQVRRPVSVRAGLSYPELGIRSFGKGTFHKPSISAEQLGSKRLYYIHPGDLIFNNVFAWECAVAVVKPEDAGRVGSHRFITCVPKAFVATTPFLYFHFTTEQGLHDLGDASPGGAGRNRTLGLKSLAAIKVPVPDYEQQVVFARLWEKVETMRQLQTGLTKDLTAYIPALLAKAFRGEL